MPRIKGKPIIAKGWLCRHKGCDKTFTTSVKAAFEAVSMGMIVHRVQVRSVVDMTKKES